MTKKLIALLMCLCMMLGLASCQKAAEPVAVATEVPVVTEAPAAEETVATEETAPAAEETVATEETAPAAEETAATEETAPAAEETVATEETAPAAEETVATEETAPAAEETAATEETAPAIPELNPTDVIAIVNGEELTWGVAQSYYNSFLSQYGAYYDMTLPENVETFRAVAGENAVLEVIRLQKAKELGIVLTDEEMAAATAEAEAIWEDNIQYYISNTYPELTAESPEADLIAAREEAIAYLESAGLTYEYIMTDYPKSVLFNRMYELITQDVVVTDADVEAHYQALVAQDKALYENDIDAYIAYNSNVDMNNMYAMYGMADPMDYAWYRPEGFRGVKHILLSVDESLMQNYLNIQAQLEEQGGEGTVTQADLDNARAAILAANQQKIDEINERLANGEDFEALIPEYTLDSANLYEVSIASTNYVPEFVEAAFSVDTVGDVSAPYISQFGIHIVKYMSDIPAGPVEMTEDQRASMMETLLITRKDDLYSATVDTWKAEATIEYTGVILSYDELLASMTADEAAEEASPEATEAPVEETTPEVTEAPVEETAPEVTEAPVEETAPEVTEAPVEETTPEVTEAPAE